MHEKRTKPTAEQCRDAGLALVLVCLVGFQAWQQPVFVKLAILLLLVAMTCPRIFQPFAIVWFALSDLLGTLASRAILVALFYLLVLPIGLARRLLGYDSLRAKEWKQGKETAFKILQRRYEPRDLDHPY